MREITRDEHFPQDNSATEDDATLNQDTIPSDNTITAPVVNTDEPTEAQLVIISLLMRNYDLLLALLGHFNEDRADEIYDAHARGVNFNPQVFIPKITE